MSEVTAIQRELADLSATNQRGDFRLLGLQRRGGFNDVDGLGGGADFEDGIDADRAAYIYVDCDLIGCFKTRSFNRDIVFACNQTDGRIAAAVVRYGSPLSFSGPVR